MWCGVFRSLQTLPMSHVMTTTIIIVAFCSLEIITFFDQSNDMRFFYNN